MPFGALIAKVASPLIKSAAAKIIPKALPVVRSLGAAVGKTLGVTGAVGGTVAGGYQVGQMVGDLYYGSSQPGPAYPAQSIDYSPWQSGVPSGGEMITVGRGPAARPGGAPMAGRGGGGAGYAVGAAAGRKLRGLMDQFGRKWSARRVAALARRLGVDAAAAALGVGAALVVDMVSQDSMRMVRRRRRGISYSQLSTTRRTLRKLDTMNRYLCRPAGVTRRTKACR